MKCLDIMYRVLYLMLYLHSYHSIIFILCSSLLLFIFVPKVQFHRNKNKAKLGGAITKSMKMKNVSSPNPSLNKMSSNLTDVSTSSEVSSTGGYSSARVSGGVKIYDTPAMREETKKQNEKLMKENAQLMLRVSELEGLLGKAKATGGVNEEVEKKTSVTFNTEEKEEEEGDSAV